MATTYLLETVCLLHTAQDKWHQQHGVHELARIPQLLQRTCGVHAVVDSV